MAVDFGINVTLISDEMLEEMLVGWDEFHFEATGQHLKFDEPGMGSIVKGTIRGIEKSIITSYEPFIAVANVVCEVTPPTPDNLLKFIDKVGKIINSIAELLAGLPESLINFLIEKILDPILKEWYIPIPGIPDLLKMLTGQLDMSKVNWEEKLKNGEMIIPPKLQKGISESKEWASHIAQVLQVKEFLPKVLEFLLMPIKLAIGMIKSVIDKVKEMITELPKAIETISKFASNPVGEIMELIGEIFKPIIKSMMENFLPKKKDFPNMPKIPEIDFNALISKIFDGTFLSGKKINEFMSKHPEFGAIFGPIIMFSGIFNWLTSLMKPDIILPSFIPC